MHKRGIWIYGYIYICSECTRRMLFLLYKCDVNTENDLLLQLAKLHKSSHGRSTNPTASVCLNGV